MFRLKEVFKLAPQETIASLGVLSLSIILGATNTALRLSPTLNPVIYKALGENLGNVMFWQGGDLASSLCAPAVCALSFMNQTIKDYGHLPEKYLKNMVKDLALKRATAISLLFPMFYIIYEVVSGIAKHNIDSADILAFSTPILAAGTFALINKFCPSRLS